MESLQYRHHFHSTSPSSIVSRQTWPRRRRRVHHKVKTGCGACKVRRQKCDERTPLCSGCDRYSTECVYPTKNYPRSKDVVSNDTPLRVELPSPHFSTRSLPASPPTELNLGDLELLHQFLTYTCIANGQLPEITTYVQATLVPLAHAFPFVMRGMLAMAATHLSRLRPSRQAHFAALAAKNHNSALPDFRSNLRNINEENCYAVIFFSKSLLWCSLARDDSYDDSKLDRSVEDNWLPPWFWLLRGSCHIVEFSRSWINEGPHVLYKLDNALDYAEEPSVQRISTLTSRLLLVKDPTPCKPIVLSALREAFARASMHHHNTPVRNAINFWIAALPDDYINLLRKKEPWALVVLAHFCVLMHRFETVWFMKTRATRLMLAVVENLDTSWRPYIHWPCKEVGIE